MKEPIWVDRYDCLAMHEKLLDRFGGLKGIRDEGLLDSALNKPMHLFSYGKPSVFEMAASYALGIVKNHPFLDGNKRTGFVAAALFIESNGFSFQASEEEAVLETLALAASKSTEEDYAAWLERNSVPAGT
ncbi:MAG: type II toxin-antitoxin system death-on-curing family toxin [bacterium]|jgi:death-on-curing protein